MKNLKWIILATVSVLAMQGCAHTETNKKIDQKVAREPQVSTNAELQVEGANAVKNAPGLSDAQRAQLDDLRKTTRSQVSELQSESLKLRSLLIKEMLASDYDREEVDVLKGRLRSVEKKRLNTIFGAIEKADVILDHKTSAENVLMMDTFFEKSGHE